MYSRNNTKILLKMALSLFLSITYIGSVHCQEENPTSPVTGVLDGVADQSDITDRTKDLIEKIRDKGIDVADKSGLWLPEGFFDGPDNDDIFLSQLILVFGHPVNNIWRLISSNAADATSDTATVTLATLYAKIMNSIGTIIIMVTMLGSTGAFFAKRAMDVSYLTVQKEEVLPFVMARGSIASLITFPIPALGGMSLLQGMTIFVILMGIGASTSLIRLSIPYTLSPGMAFVPQPHIARFVDYILEAKTCTIGMGELNGNSPAEFRSFNSIGFVDQSKDVTLGSGNNPYQNKRIEKVVAYFGVNGTGDCGQLTLNEYYKSYYGSTNLDSLIRLAAHQTAAESSRKFLKEIWENDLINDIAIKLNAASLENLEGDAERYAIYREQMQDKVIGEITVLMRNKLNSDLDPSVTNSNISSEYANAIASVGFMGLGSFHTMITYRQMEVTQILSDIYADKEGANWSPVTTDSVFSSAWRSFLSFISDEPQLGDLENAKANMSLFYNSTSKYALNNDMQSVMNSAMAKLTNSNVAQSLGQEIIEIVREDSNGVSFPNPIIEMRTIGNSILNTATFVAGAALIAEALPAGKVVDALPDQLVNAVDITSMGEKGGAMATAVILSLLGIGGFYSFIVPNIPYIMWSIACFSYLSYAVGSVISAGWWGGSMVLSNPGNERSFSGRFQEGANIILTLSLRPTLMTMSFFIAMILNIALGYYLHWTLEAAAVSASFGGFNILALIGVLFINAIIMTAGLIKNHSLVWELPDQFQRMLSFKSAIDDKSHDSAVSTAQQMSGSLTQNVSSVANVMLKKAEK